MAMFISKTRVRPYMKVTEIPFEFDLTGIQYNLDVAYTDPKLLFLVLEEGESYPYVELLVANENYVGVSLYISPIDVLGHPTDWGKQIIIDGGMDASAGDVTYPFVVRWGIINNVFFNTQPSNVGTINVYVGE